MRAVTIGGFDRRWAVLAGILFLAACSGSGADGTCAIDGDCEGGVCVGGQCIAAQPKGGCTSDDMCPLGEACDVVSGTCAKPQIVSCAMDTECPSDQRCNQATGVCVVGNRPCTGLTEGECPDRHCDVARQVCVDCLQPS